MLIMICVMVGLNSIQIFWACNFDAYSLRTTRQIESIIPNLAKNLQEFLSVVKKMIQLCLLPKYNWDVNHVQQFFYQKVTIPYYVPTLSLKSCNDPL